MHRARSALLRRPWQRYMLMALASLLIMGLPGVAGPDDVAAGAPDHREQVRFMWAMARRESNADYFARNPGSGAYGKYQIMPVNWPAWANEYLSDGRADQTPYNQEKVAYRKLRDLYRWLGSWKRVAYWWLTGSSNSNEQKWSSYAKGYVTDIMRWRKQAPARDRTLPPRTSSRPERGDWRRSGSRQTLRRAAADRAWAGKGRLRDGQVLKVRAVKRTGRREYWIGVVTADGRLGWLRHLSTVPARRPARPARWEDVNLDGSVGTRADRAQVRPRPR